MLFVFMLVLGASLSPQGSIEQRVPSVISENVLQVDSSGSSPCVTASISPAEVSLSKTLNPDQCQTWDSVAEPEL